MIKSITRYVTYLLAAIAILFVIMGYNMIPLFLSSIIIYLSLLIAYIATGNLPSIREDEEKPYKELIKSANSIYMGEDNTSLTNAASMPTYDFPSDEDYDPHIDNSYDPEEDVYFDQEEEIALSKSPDIEKDPLIDSYRRIKIDKVLAQVEKIPKMGGIEFEEYLRDLYDALGYSVLKTDINDQGADLIVMHGNEKIVIQAKRYKNKVNNSAIQQVFTAKSFYDCDRAIVITNSQYTKSAREVAEKVGVELWDSISLNSMLSSMRSI